MLRYQTGADSKDDNYAMLVLDEAMENVNDYTKKLVVGEDEKSWVVYSPNVAVARKFFNFEKNEFVWSSLNFNNN